MGSLDVSVDTEQLKTFIGAAEEDIQVCALLLEQMRSSYLSLGEGSSVTSASLEVFETVYESFVQSHAFVSEIDVTIEGLSFWSDSQPLFFGKQSVSHLALEQRLVHSGIHQAFVEYVAGVDDAIGAGDIARAKRIEEKYAYEMVKQSSGDLQEFTQLVNSGMMPLVAMRQSTAEGVAKKVFSHQQAHNTADLLLSGKSYGHVATEHLPIEYRELHERLAQKKTLESRRNAVDGRFGIGKDEKALANIDTELAEIEKGLDTIFATGLFTEGGEISSTAKAISLLKSSVSENSGTWAGNYGADRWLADEDYESQHGKHGLNTMGVEEFGIQLLRDENMAATFFSRLGAKGTARVPTLLNRIDGTNIYEEPAWVGYYSRGLATATRSEKWKTAEGSFTGAELLNQGVQLPAKGLDNYISPTLLFKEGIFEQEFVVSAGVEITSRFAYGRREVFDVSRVGIDNRIWEQNQMKAAKQGYDPRSMVYFAAVRSGSEAAAEVVIRSHDQACAGYVFAGYQVGGERIKDKFLPTSGLAALADTASKDPVAAAYLLETFSQSGDAVPKNYLQVVDPVLANSLQTRLPEQGIGNLEQLVDTDGKPFLSPTAWDQLVAQLYASGEAKFYSTASLQLVGKSIDQTLQDHGNKSGHLTAKDFSYVYVSQGEVGHLDGEELKQKIVENAAPLAEYSGKFRRVSHEKLKQHHKDQDAENERRQEEVAFLIGQSTGKLDPRTAYLTEESANEIVNDWLGLDTDNTELFLETAFENQSVDTMRARQGILKLLVKNGLVDGFAIIKPENFVYSSQWLIVKTDEDGVPIANDAGVFEPVTQKDFNEGAVYSDVSLSIDKGYGDLSVSEFLDIESQITSIDEEAWQKAKK